MRGYNAMLAVQNVHAAKMYYEELHNQQASIPEECRLRIGMIYSFAANESRLPMVIFMMKISIPQRWNHPRKNF